MRNCEHLLVALACAGTLHVSAQEVLLPLSARPVPGAMLELRKSTGLNEHFIYLNATQELPIVDDFSIDRTRKRWAQSTDADVTLIQTIYALEVNGASEVDMLFSTDSTFLFLTDTTGTDTTTRTALPSVMVTVRDVTSYPPTEEVVEGWPAYNIFDTVPGPSSPDTLFIVPADLVQDSLLVYEVAPDTRTFTRADNSIVPLILWEDDDVYINGNYPIEPPTIGVATFDGLARTGYPYNYAQYTAHGIADHLTSVPIDLEYPASDSIYLSFFYQPQGLSSDNNVQPIDSLVLEFYAPDEDLWYRVWRKPYVALQPFEQVLVPITQPRFLKDDFRFRFLNYATLSGSFDHWHIDYVRLGAQRTFDDTRLIDVAYLYPEVSLLQTYTSVPFHKFETAPASYMAPSITAQQRNLDNVDRFITYGMLAREENGGGPAAFNNGQNTSGNASLIFPSTHAVGNAPNNFAYDPTVSTDAAFWRVKLWTNTTPDVNRYNDTITFIQELSNYMSYDDGSAEMGYGLLDAGNALAYRFDIVGGDSLRAVRMYFNPQANDPQSSPNPLQGSFLVTVWSSLSPETILHQNFSFSAPQYRQDGIDHFVEYALDSTIYVEGTFYVGWVQTTDVRMNLGFDRNRNNQNKIFFKTTGGFGNTTFEGSLMMRPVFVAAVDPFAGVQEAAPKESSLLLVPNPANDAVFVRCDAAGPGASVQLFDATGRMVLQAPWMAERALPLASLNTGLYVVRAVDRNGVPLAQERLIVQR